MSEPEDLLEEDTLKSKMELTSQMTDHHFEKVEDDEISRFLKSDKEPKPEEKAKFVPAAPRKKFGFSDVTVDAKLLMKDVVKSNPKTPLASGQRGRVIELSQPKKVDPDSTTVEKKTRKERAMKVKKTAEPSSRRHSKQKQQKEDQNEPPPTQMQALELKELQLTVSGETSLANVEEPQINDTEEDDLVTEDKEFEEAIEDGAFSGMPSMMSDYTVKMTVPDLPSIPSEPNVKDSPKLTAAESKALLMSKLDRRSAIDFVGVSKGEHTKGGQKGSPEDVAKSHEKTGASRLELPVDSLTSRYQEGGQGSAAGHQLRVSSNEQQRSTDSIGELKSPKVHVTPSVQFEGTKPNEGNRSGSFSKERLASSSLDDRKSSVQDVFISRTAPTSHTWAVPRKTTQNSFESQGTPYIQSNTPLLSEFSYNHLNPMTPETYFEDEEVQIIRESSHDAASIVDQSERHGSLSDTVWPDQFSMSITRQPSQPDDPRQADKQNVGANVNYQSADLLSLSEASQAGTQSKALVEENLLGRSAVQTGLATKSESPPTAKVRFHPEDLQAAFENSILSYQSMARSGLISDKLYKNDDQAFAENWHERQIERHMLIRMQKKLRTLNVHKKRQLLEHMKQERLKEHVLNDHMTDKTRTTIAPSLYQRATTVHGTRPTISIPVPTPMSSRPHTAAGNYNSGRALVPQPQQFQQQQQQQGSPLSLHQQIHQALDQRARQQEVELTQKEKSELGLKKSFRFTMRPTKDASSKFGGTSDPSPELDPWLLDPRNPQAFRPKSSKSIPSKCHQYVLITKPKTPLITPLPTPLEEQLLAARFPDQGEKVYKQYEGLLFRPPRRPMYGIGYSPYEHQLYG
ncbi:unnamed protein product [Lymnaea stagnalis]|uniref:Uncharacterized protein n=1 Tax=Lymnaea stagnalis TaxID=6523 RepID=A0AAV2HP57_LYMST